MPRAPQQLSESAPTARLNFLLNSMSSQRNIRVTSNSSVQRQRGAPVAAGVGVGAPEGIGRT